MSKARWVNIMQQAGFSEDGMTQWHQQFEARAPQAHQAFLESLNLTTTEIAKIRAL
ncbi:putative MerR-family transcriptional regulator [Vibrio astriarenae]|nr:putative MerR-family transcriptional regulator [Vibrio sp. C7]